MPDSTVISSVTFTPQSPRAGEDVRVDVYSPDQTPYDNKEHVLITIDGVPGSRQYKRWETPGQKTVQVMAWHDGKAERVSTTIEVQPSESEATASTLRVERMPEAPTTVVFSGLIPTNAWRPKGRGSAGRKGIRFSTSLRDSRFAGLFTAAENSAPVYTWDFGDGTTLGTTMPTIGHDFGPSLAPDRQRSVFTVKLTAARQGFHPIVLFQTVSILNLYNLAKRRGVIQPPVESDLNATFEKDAFRARMTVRNPEDDKLVLSSRLIEVFFEDPDAPSRFLSEERVTVNIAANDTTDVGIVVSSEAIPSDAVAFAVHFAGAATSSRSRFRSSGRPLGRATGKMPVRVSAYFDIPGRRHRKPLPIGPLHNFLNEVSRRKLVPNPRSISFREIESLVSRGLVAAPELEDDDRLEAGVFAKVAGLARLAPTDPGTRKLMSKHMEPMAAIEGAECDPTNLPSDVQENLVCQMTDEPWRWVPMPGRFMNARKGDAILSPGDNGFIGELLRQVDPPQNYSHSGIMTRNHDEITHSTASPARLAAYPQGGGDPTDGFEPYALKYLWPGVITQTVENAVEGEWFADPDDSDGKTYEITSFNPDIAPGPTEVIPALVVKPDPFEETQNVRQQLSAIADFAHQQAGKSHYRFFCYTDPSIGLTDKAPDDAGWAAGTFPTVCSSFIWMCVQQSGAAFENALEPKDEALGAEPSTKAEGLYRYSADERLAAGEWLYTALYNDVMETAGPVGNALTDIADDIANQMLNTFESDWSDTEAKDSDAWKQVEDADAVSPDNILWWDGPSAGGVYGFSEPLIYRPPRLEFVPVHRWKKVVEKGALTGRVTFQGTPEQGVRVEVFEGMFAFSGSDGSFQLTDVPVGPYLLRASKVRPDGTHLSGEEPVTVKEGSTDMGDFEVDLPSDFYRQIVIDGLMVTDDDEGIWASATAEGFLPLFAIMRVGPFDTHDKVSFVDHVGGEIRAELHFEADWHPDKSVTVAWMGFLFEGTSSDTDDLDESSSNSFVVQPDTSGGWSWKMVSDESGSDDWVSYEFTATNQMQQT